MLPMQISIKEYDHLQLTAKRENGTLYYLHGKNLSHFTIPIYFVFFSHKLYAFVLYFQASHGHAYIHSLHA
jgi:hypothetical protein